MTRSLPSRRQFVAASAGALVSVPGILRAKEMPEMEEEPTEVPFAEEMPEMEEEPSEAPFGEEMPEMEQEPSAVPVAEEMPEEPTGDPERLETYEEDPDD